MQNPSFPGDKSGGKRQADLEADFVESRHVIIWFVKWWVIIITQITQTRRFCFTFNSCSCPQDELWKKSQLLISKYLQLMVNTGYVLKSTKIIKIHLGKNNAWGWKAWFAMIYGLNEIMLKLQPEDLPGIYLCITFAFDYILFYLPSFWYIPHGQEYLVDRMMIYCVSLWVSNFCACEFFSLAPALRLPLVLLCTATALFIQRPAHRPPKKEPLVAEVETLVDHSLQGCSILF